MVRIELMGNITRPPLMRTTKNGKKQCSFSVATDYKNKTSDGETKRITDYYNISTFGESAFLCGTYLYTGSRVFVQGDLRPRKYQTNDGQDRVSLDVFSQNITFLDGKSKKAVETEQKLEEESKDDPYSDLTEDDIPF